ncbi:hypothetical protein T261_0858 [Streptomyces lydicus]|nr:hypothetical protein T261_0858 [Streptomyces lydicus]
MNHPAPVGTSPAGAVNRLHALAGSWHVPSTTTGCTLFLFYPEG